MASNFHLTTGEYNLVNNAEFLHTKNIILKKVIALFSALNEHFVEEASGRLPGALTAVAPKISRGEQYLGLPYVMLDYPRMFSRENTFAIRTFFWWGNFFSIHLQLSGVYQQQFAPTIIRRLAEHETGGWFVAVGEEEWSHHFEEVNYRPVEHVDVNQIINTHSFVKLAKKIPLQQWEHVEYLLKKYFNEILKLTTH